MSALKLGQRGDRKTDHTQQNHEPSEAPEPALLGHPMAECEQNCRTNGGYEDQTPGHHCASNGGQASIKSTLGDERNQGGQFIEHEEEGLSGYTRLALPATMIALIAWNHNVLSMLYLPYVLQWLWALPAAWAVGAFKPGWNNGWFYNLLLPTPLHQNHIIFLLGVISLALFVSTPHSTNIWPISFNDMGWYFLYSGGASLAATRDIGIWLRRRAARSEGRAS